MSGNVLRNCKDARTATSPCHLPKSAIDGCPDFERDYGRNYGPGMVETYDFLSNLPSQFYGF